MDDLVPTVSSSTDKPLSINGLKRDALDQAERQVFRKLNEVAVQVKREHPGNLSGAALRASVYKKIGNGDMARGQRKVNRVITVLSITHDQIFDLIDREIGLE